MYPVKQIQYIGLAAHIRCKIIGGKWKKDGKNLPDDIVVNADGISITHAKLYHTGTYECYKRTILRTIRGKATLFAGCK